MLALRTQGVTDPAVLSAMERTPRDLLPQALFKERSWRDSALPIACGQTVSQPYIVGLMSQALTLEPRARVLEIGTGSGYQTAVLARLSRLVYTVERYRTLLKEAEARFSRRCSSPVSSPSSATGPWVGPSRRHLTAFWSRRRLKNSPRCCSTS